ncbi:MAG: hypothetical protein JXR10_08480 [Cyclobacteriaceae bacterium]
MKNLLAGLLLLIVFTAHSQRGNVDSLKIKELESQVNTLRYTELVQSMSQRSLLTPSYFQELKALIARQAYSFWRENDSNPLVSHLNLYSALYYANKFLGYDSVNRKSYNEALGHNASVVSLQFSQDPDYFYSAGSDGRVMKWQLSTKGKTAELVYEGDHLIKSIDISTDDRWILVVTKNEGIVLIDNETEGEMGQGSQRQVITDGELVQSAVFVPEEHRMLVVTKDGLIKSKGFGKEKQIGQTAQQVSSAIINKKNKDLYLGKSTGEVELWEDTLSAKIYLEEAFAVNAMAISPDFKTLAIGREKGDIILWDIENEEIIRTISGHQSAITDLDFSPDNLMLLSSSRDRTVRVWEIANSKKLPLVLDDHNDWVLTACFDPTGNQIISGSKDNYIRFWPVFHVTLANRICELVERNLTKEEWDEYVGELIPYQTTCD